MEKRKCYKCQKEKDINLFVKNRSHPLGYAYICKECRNSFRKSDEYRKKERERISSNPDLKKRRNEYAYLWKKNNKEQVKQTQRSWFLKKLYGMTLEDYNKMFEKQKGCCAICEKHQSMFNKTLNIDHDHKTGKVRELLCGPCNTTLGNVEDNIEILKKMIDYLNKHKE